MAAVKCCLAKASLPVFHSKLPSMPRARVLSGSSCSSECSSSRLCPTHTHTGVSDTDWEEARGGQQQAGTKMITTQLFEF